MALLRDARTPRPRFVNDQSSLPGTSNKTFYSANMDTKMPGNRYQVFWPCISIAKAGPLWTPVSRTIVKCDKTTKCRKMMCFCADYLMVWRAVLLNVTTLLCTSFPNFMIFPDDSNTQFHHTFSSTGPHAHLEGCLTVFQCFWSSRS